MRCSLASCGAAGAVGAAPRGRARAHTGTGMLCCAMPCCAAWRAPVACSPASCHASVLLQDVKDDVHGDGDETAPSALWTIVVKNYSLPIAAAAAKALVMPAGVQRDTPNGDPWTKTQEGDVCKVLVSSFAVLEQKGHGVRRRCGGVDT